MEPEHLLWEAVKSNDIKTTQLLLSCICTCGKSVDASRTNVKLGNKTQHDSEAGCSISGCPPNLLNGCRCKSVEVNKQENGLYPIHLAMINNNDEMLTLLINHGAIFSSCQFTSVSCYNHNDVTFLQEFGPLISPLTLAVAFGDTEMVTLVFERSSFRLDATALLLACKLGCFETVEVLLKRVKHAKASKGSRKDLMSPLLYATKSNCNVDIVKLLLDHGSDPTVKDDEGNTPLHIASGCGCESTVKLLMSVLKQANVSPCIVNSYEKSPFHLACKYGHYDILKHLLLHKCTISCDSAAKQYLLHEAAKYSQVNIVRLLLQNEFNVNQFDSFAKTALFEAVMADNLEVVELLLEAHADTNIPCDPYESPILYAAEHSSPKVVEALLRGGADVNTTDMVGVTPLIHAAKRCPSRNKSHKEDITALLLQYGADITHTYLHTHTALSIAVACGNITCARILLEAGAKMVLIHVAKDRECAELLLKNGAPVDLPNALNKTALVYACRSNNLDVAHLLIEYRADVSKMTVDGTSPLFFAISNDSTLMVKDLIMAGACNVNDRVLVYFTSMLELALFLRANFNICHLLHLAGAVVSTGFLTTCILHDSSSYIQFIATTLPQDSWRCKLWLKFVNKTSFNFWDGLEESVKIHSKMMSLEELCCDMLRKYLSFNKQAMMSLCLPENVINKLILEIY